ncbi:MAG: DUF5606 domain-containing protein [Bacteroidota bacterium]
MDLSKLVAISGKPGIYRMISNKENGLIVEDLDNGKKRFVSGRKHQFTPLESISIYTWDDTVELKTVFQAMFEHLAEHPLPSNKEKADTLRAYFTTILPNHDTERVYTNDISKLIKWFKFLESRNLISAESVEKETNQDEEE